MDPSAVLEAHPIKLQGSYRDQLASVLSFEALAKAISTTNVKTLSQHHVDPVATDEQGLPKRPGLSPETAIPRPDNFRVCIIGAGISGLYSAMILEKLGVPYDIYESSERCGGRLRTHYFTDRERARETHDYYDIGAMRFPDTPVMNSVFRLFDRAKITPHLKPYYMKSQTVQPFRYNDITRFYNPQAATDAPNGSHHKTRAAPPDLAEMLDHDPFKVGVKNGGCVPDDSVKNADQIMADAFSYYTAKIKRDPMQGFRYLLRHDKFSLRDYLQFVEDHDRNTIAWLETLNSATGWFDMAFTENVLEQLAFDYLAYENLDYEITPAERADKLRRRHQDEANMWKCINGGTETLIDAIFAQNLVTQPVWKNHPVVSLSQPLAGGKISVHYVDKLNAPGRTHIKSYDAVINTTTLAALQKMDLSGLHLPYAHKTAIRSLRYDTSSKVGIKFKKAWWIHGCEASPTLSVRGGLGKTDLPLRICVYPSYNLDDHGEAVLLCSYTWGQDSERIASMIKPDSPHGEDDLKALLLDNLARLHTPPGQDHTRLLAEISDLYLTHHAYDWSKDPHAAGAFALFGAGQFQELYATLVHPVCDSRLHIVGEHASAHHAWIAGALDSAARGVWNVLERFRMDELQDKMKEEFPPSPEIDYQRAHLAVALGMKKTEEESGGLVGDSAESERPSKRMKR